ncbi:MAG: DUF3592 domain-containing protein [Amphiplicatus sp.]
MPQEAKLRLELGLAVALFSVLTVLGVAIGGFGVHDFARARASLVWPVAEGVVLSQADNAPGLRYAYSFNGRTYESTRIRFFTARFSASPIAEQTPGDVVGVSVNPAEPDVSALAPGGSGLVFAFIVLVAGVFVFVGLGGLIRTVAEASRLELGGEGVGGEPAY